MNILFLYTELADYTMACLKALKREDVQLMVIHYPVNSEAPFRLNFEGIGRFLSISNFDDATGLQAEVEAFHPDIIICSGWSNKTYLKICRSYRSQIPTVLTMDNHWQGSTRQRVLSLLSPFTLQRAFEYCWVPGKPQVEYGKKLGFPGANIFTGFYCCDLYRFNELFASSFPGKEQSFPRRPA